MIRISLLSIALLFASLSQAISEEDIIKSHAIALFGSPKYKADFKHYDFVNPDAPKGGRITLSVGATSYDSFNPFIPQGTPASGIGLTFDSLMDSSWDEINTYYCLICETVEYPKNRSWVIFNLNKQAYFHDKSPITSEDVLFSYNFLRKSHPALMPFFKNIEKADILSPYKIKFTLSPESSRELIMIIGSMPIFSKKYWQDKNIHKVTLEPPIFSGPYKVKSFDAGKSVTYERDKDYWAKNHPANIGYYNFDEIHYDYYRDETIRLEAFKAKKYDFRNENSARNWATAYTVKELESGLLKKEKIYDQLPKTMQGWIFNIRKPYFKDRRVREALSYAYDFEWYNKNIAYSAYNRTRSFWQNSKLEAKGLPSEEEKKILTPYKDQLPSKLFTHEYNPPKTNGSGRIRQNIKKADKLLKEAGWILKNNKRVFKETNKVFKFEITLHSKQQEQLASYLVNNLKRLGIDVHLRTVDTSTYINRVRNHDFDMISMTLPSHLTPGPELKGAWTSQSADIKSSTNYIGVKNPVIDRLVQKIIEANDQMTLETTTTALDRVLQWEYYIIPHFYAGYSRVVFWDKFGRPIVKNKPTLRGESLYTWWIDPEKEKRFK